MLKISLRLSNLVCCCYEGLDYFITWSPAHAYLHTNSFVHTENVFRSALQKTEKRSDLYPLQRLQARLSCKPALSMFNTEQRWPVRWPRFPTTMLSFSWINLLNISISDLIKPCSENIVQILVQPHLRCLPYCHIRFISTLSFATDCI